MEGTGFLPIPEADGAGGHAGRGTGNRSRGIPEFPRVPGGTLFVFPWQKKIIPASILDNTGNMFLIPPWLRHSTWRQFYKLHYGRTWGENNKSGRKALTWHEMSNRFRRG